MRQALRLDGMDCDFQVSEDGEKAIDFIDAIDKTESGPHPTSSCSTSTSPVRAEHAYWSESGKAPNAVGCRL